MYLLIGFILLILAGVFLIILANKTTAGEQPESLEPNSRPITSDCCGAHEVCEFDASVFDEKEIIYFNDEELDELRNIREDQITNSQIDDLREVLYTLQPEEISKWMISLGQRHIHLPTILQQEARQLMAEKQPGGL